MDLSLTTKAQEALSTAVRDAAAAGHAQVEPAVREEVAIVKELEAVASKHPYYKYNSKWSRAVQGAIGTTVYCAWLGGFPPSQTSDSESSSPAEIGRLLTLEEVGTIFSGKTSP